MISSMPRSHLRLYAMCGVIAPIFFVLMVVVEGFLATGEENAWTRYGAFSLASLVLAITSGLVFAIFGQPGSPVTGLLQRVMMFFILLWIEVMALRLFRLAKA